MLSLVCFIRTQTEMEKVTICGFRGTYMMDLFLYKRQPDIVTVRSLTAWFNASQSKYYKSHNSTFSAHLPSSKW